MSTAKAIAVNTLVQSAGKLVSVVLGVITIAAMTRLLGDAGFGQYATITTFLMLVGIFVDFGLSMTTVRLMSDPRHDREQIVRNVFTFRLVTSVIAYGLAPVLALALPYPAEVRLGIAIASGSFLLIALNQVLNGVFQYELQTKYITYGELAGRVITLAGIGYLYATGGGLLAAVAAVVAGNVANFALLWISAQRFTVIRPAWDFAVWRSIVTTTWPIALSIMFNLVYFKADTLILSLTRTAAEVGIYSAPYRVLEILITFPYIFMGVVFPVMTAAWAAGDRERFSRMFHAAFDGLAYAGAPIAVGAQFVATGLMVLIAGSDFAASGPLLALISIPTAFIFINTVFGYLIVVVERQRAMVWAYAAVAAASLAAYLYWIPTHGMWAAAWITLASEAAMLAANCIASTRVTGIFPRAVTLVRAGAACACMAAALYITGPLPVLARIGIAAAVYIAALYAVGGISPALIAQLRGTAAREPRPL